MTVRLLQGDCLEEMPKLASGSVDLVLCDPPYGTIKGIEGTGHYDARTDWDDALDPAAFFKELNRIARPNAAVVLFSQEPYTSRLVTQAHGSIPFAYRMIWEKDHFANALGAKKAPVSYFEDIVVFFKAFDSFLGHPLKRWFDLELITAGMTRKEAVARWGSTASHYFTDGRQFLIPSAEKLAQMQADTGRFQMSHDEMRAVSTAFRDETRARYPKVFNLPEGQKSKSNILRYRKDYDGFHPTQKPTALLEDLIATYSNPGDTVLDFTMGSGSTGVAAVRTGRAFVGIERDPQFFETAEARIAAAQMVQAPDSVADYLLETAPKAEPSEPDLFSEVA